MDIYLTEEQAKIIAAELGNTSSCKVVSETTYKLVIERELLPTEKLVRPETKEDYSVWTLSHDEEFAQQCLNKLWETFSADYFPPSLRIKLMRLIRFLSRGKISLRVAKEMADYLSPFYSNTVALLETKLLAKHQLTYNLFIEGDIPYLKVILQTVCYYLSEQDAEDLATLIVRTKSLPYEELS